MSAENCPLGPTHDWIYPLELICGSIPADRSGRVYKALDRRVAVDIVYLDFSKVFDTVPHTRLMCKVKSTGLENSVFKSIEN